MCVCVQLFSQVRLCDPTECSPPGSSVHGIFQTRILEQVAISSSRGPSWSRDRTWVSSIFCIAGGFSTAEPPGTSTYTSSQMSMHIRKKQEKVLEMDEVEWGRGRRHRLWSSCGHSPGERGLLDMTPDSFLLRPWLGCQREKEALSCPHWAQKEPAAVVPQWLCLDFDPSHCPPWFLSWMPLSQAGHSWRTVSASHLTLWTVNSNIIMVHTHTAVTLSSNASKHSAYINSVIMILHNRGCYYSYLTQKRTEAQKLRTKVSQHF